jgi:hypothetical protein
MAPNCANQHPKIFYQWCHQESNRGHKDFQSFALPTELWHLADLRMQKYEKYPNKQNFLSFFFNRAYFLLISRDYSVQNEQFYMQL